MSSTQHNLPNWIILTYDEEYGEKFSENHEDDKNYDDEIIRQDLLVSNDLIIVVSVNRCGTPAYQTIIKVHHFLDALASLRPVLEID